MSQEISRKAFLQGRWGLKPLEQAKQLGNAAKVVAALALLADRITLPLNDERVFSDGLVHVILSAHALPEGYPIEELFPNFKATIPFFPGVTAEQEAKQVLEGNPKGGIWEGTVGERMIDQRWKLAKANGQDRVFIVPDGLQYGDSYWSWSGMPHPLDMSKKAASQYPDRITAIGTELSNPYFATNSAFLPDKASSEEKTQANALAAELALYYGVYTKFTQAATLAIGATDVIKDSLEVAAASALLKNASPTRRRLLQTLLVSFLALKLGCATGAFSDVTSEAANSTVQGILTDLNNISPSSTLAQIPALRWAITRTALAVQHAKDIARQKQSEVDVLYGTDHDAFLGDILADPIQFISHFMQEHLTLVDGLIHNYPALGKYRSRILFYTLVTMSVYTFFDMNIPWGKQKLPSDFSAQVLHSDGLDYSDRIYDIAIQILLNNGVTQEEIDTFPFLPHQQL